MNWIGLLSALFVMGTSYLFATGSLLVNPTLKDMQNSSNHTED